MTILQKIIDCKNLGISQENLVDGVSLCYSASQQYFKMQICYKENSPQIHFRISTENQLY